jgi:hypothetical protein
LADDLSLATPCYVRVLRVLVEIRDGVQDISGGRESAAIAEVIDIDFIRGQAELGVFGWDSYKRLVESAVGIIQRLQAPKRDAETRARWITLGISMDAPDVNKPRVLCQTLEFLLDRVNALRIDAANAR